MLTVSWPKLHQIVFRHTESNSFEGHSQKYYLVWFSLFGQYCNLLLVSALLLAQIASILQINLHSQNSTQIFEHLAYIPSHWQLCCSSWHRQAAVFLLHGQWIPLNLVAITIHCIIHNKESRDEGHLGFTHGSLTSILYSERKEKDERG